MQIIVHIVQLKLKHWILNKTGQTSIHSVGVLSVWGRRPPRSTFSKPVSALVPNCPMVTARAHVSTNQVWENDSEWKFGL